MNFSWRFKCFCFPRVMKSPGVNRHLLKHSMKRFSFRWLGTAGLELNYAGQRLLIDPFFTRPPVHALLRMARVTSNEALAQRLAPRADHILVTHPHYDHLLDVPAILQRTGARAYGSPSTCQILALHGIPAGQVRCIQPGDRLELGPFQVEVFPGFHTRTPADRLVNGPLAPRLHLPLRLTDYRMDACYSFRIRAGAASGAGRQPPHPRREPVSLALPAP
jgi:L-ascorbate metabolism protein UlaG (beta-lactamase superfamily)